MTNKITLNIFAAAVLMLQACGGGQDKSIEKTDQFDYLISYIENGNDFMNSPDAPAVISIAELLPASGTHIHLIDLREKADYLAGHLHRAVNIRPDNLLTYFENTIDPSAFDTIALLCEDGQDALFAIPLLRMLGYTNVYGVRYGMAWHPEFSEVWKRRLSSEYEDRLSFESSPAKQVQPTYPRLPGELTDGYTILRSRAESLLVEDTRAHRITAAEVFRNPSAYYLICYWDSAFYMQGHIPGSVHYNPKKSLGRDTELNTLPLDKPVVVYCNSGHHSSSATAYLRLLGYDARTLSYGTNSFMYTIHKEKIIRGLFSEDEVFEYPLKTPESLDEAPPVDLIKVKAHKGGC